jgi:hypothetical protein
MDPIPGTLVFLVALNCAFRGTRSRIFPFSETFVEPVNKATAWPPCSWVELQAVLDRPEFWVSQLVRSPTSETGRQVVCAPLNDQVGPPPCRFASWSSFSTCIWRSSLRPLRRSWQNCLLPDSVTHRCRYHFTSWPAGSPDPSVRRRRTQHLYLVGEGHERDREPLVARFNQFERI